MTHHVAAFIKEFPSVKLLIELEEIVWFNLNVTSLKEGWAQCR